jgi:Rrf2 family protein
MKLSQGVEWALHCALLIAQADGDAVSRRTLAGYHDLPEAYLAKHLKSLVHAGVLTATPGPKGGFRLGGSVDEITVLDIVEAIEGSVSPFLCAEIRQHGACAVPPEMCTGPCPVAKVMYDADHAWRDSLRAVTLADLAARLPASALRRAHSWLNDPTKPLPPYPRQ